MCETGKSAFEMQEAGQSSRADRKPGEIDIGPGVDYLLQAAISARIRNAKHYPYPLRLFRGRATTGEI